MNRRTMFGIGASLVPLLSRSAAAPALAPSPDVESMPLWPSGPPGTAPALQPHFAGAPNDRVATGILSPSLTVFRPTNPDGSALLIAPGGGYLQENIDIEGTEIAQRFVQAGITAFVLTYRLPPEGWGPKAPLEDAQRAMRTIRATAAHYGLDPARTGALGFSAGGHLVASLAARSGEALVPATDAIDRADARPSFFALGYPVITMLPPYAHEASREHLLGKTPANDERAAWSVERLVTADTPPAFLFATVDDPYVPVENTTLLFAALRARKVDAEMHLFARGGHGFGLRLPPDAPALEWPDLFLRWGRSRGIFRSA